MLSLVFFFNLDIDRWQDIYLALLALAFLAGAIAWSSSSHACLTKVIFSSYVSACRGQLRQAQDGGEATQNWNKIRNARKTFGNHEHYQLRISRTQLDFL